MPGVTAAMRMLTSAGYALVIVTNQSGIARGLYSESDFHAVQKRVGQMLGEEGVSVDGVYYCPHHPEYSPPCECRKPGLKMYRDAASQLGLALERSIYVGDRVKDVLPALATGGRGFLVRTGYGREEEGSVPPGILVVDDLAGVVREVVGDVDTRALRE